MLAASFSSLDTMNMIPPQQPQMDNAAQVAEKVMRRIEIAKVHSPLYLLHLFTDPPRSLEIYKIVSLSQASKLKMAGRTAL
jgi:hypothetical protein